MLSSENPLANGGGKNSQSIILIIIIIIIIIKIIIIIIKWCAWNTPQRICKRTERFGNKKTSEDILITRL